MRVSGEIAIAVVFIEGQGFGECTSRVVRHTDQVKIALQEAILSRGPVHGDQGIVQLNMLPCKHKAEVTLIYQNGLLFVLPLGANVPAIALNDDEIRGEATAVYPRDKSRSTA